MVQPGDELSDAFVENNRDALTLAMRRAFEVYHDGPVEDVRAGLGHKLERIELPVSEDWLLPYATSISMGHQVVFK